MRKATDIQRDFFKFITFSDDAITSGENASVYQELIYYRFFETIRSIYPVTVNNLGADLLENHIKKFISKGAKSLLLRDMANEFRSYLLSGFLSGLAAGEMGPYSWLEDLMWYEWSEALLLTSEPLPGTPHTADFKNYYEMSKAAVKKMISHEVYANPLKVIEPVNLLLYYDFKINKVCYQTTSGFINELINNLINNPDAADLENAFKKTSGYFKLSSSSIDEARNLVLQVMNDMLEKKILVGIS
jgi:hypothetical protein